MRFILLDIQRYVRNLKLERLKEVGKSYKYKDYLLVTSTNFLHKYEHTYHKTTIVR